MTVTAGVSSASVMDLQATRPFDYRSGQALSLQEAVFSRIEKEN
jgi:hypothetical protein